jgi:hypothetical protein
MAKAHPTMKKHQFLAGFALDQRSISAARFVLGLNLFLIFLQRYHHFLDFLEQAPVSFLANPAWKLADWKLLTGFPPFLHLILVSAALLSIGFALGWKSRLCAFLLWLQITVFNYSNYDIVDRSDWAAAILLVFFLLFPACPSLVTIFLRRQNAKKNWQVLSPLFPVFFLQVALIYLFSALYKVGESWRIQFTAVELALNRLEFKGPLSDLVLQFPTLMKLMTIVTLALEFVIPALLLLSGFMFKKVWRLRLGICLTMILFHCSIFLITSLQFFAVTSLVFWILLLPGQIWNFHRQSEFDHEIFDSKLAWSTALVLAVCLLTGNVVRYGTVQAPQASTTHFLAAAGLWQRWNMFAAESDPGERIMIRWIDVEARDRNGNWNRIYSNLEHLREKIWQKFFWRMAQSRDNQERFFQYACSKFKSNIQENIPLRIIAYQQWVDLHQSDRETGSVIQDIPCPEMQAAENGK